MTNFADNLPLPSGQSGPSGQLDAYMPAEYVDLATRTVTLTCDGEPVTLNIGRDLSFTEESLLLAMRIQPNLYDYYSGKLADAEDLVARAEYNMTRIEAEGINSARMAVVNQTGKSPTDKQAEAYARQQPAYDQAMQRLLTARDTARRLKNIVRSLEHKRAMMESVAYHQRQAMRSLDLSHLSAPPPAEMPRFYPGRQA